jgi:hypothetical protein
MAKGKAKPSKYQTLSDLEMLKKQWVKLSGLHSREEYSAAIVRSATAAEIAANLAIRAEFKDHSKFSADVVDSFLWSANGLRGKMMNLVLPLVFKNKKTAAYKKLFASALTINERRNAVAHQGIFCNKIEAQEVIREAKKFIEVLVDLYEPGYELPDEGFAPSA